VAGRRAAPPIDLSLCHGLFGRKEKRKPKDFNFANTFLRKTPLAIFLYRLAGHFAQTPKNFCFLASVSLKNCY